jgi:hypothetical protein
MCLEQRPWVGIEIVPRAIATNITIDGPGLQGNTVAFVAHNTGKTPAVNWASKCCESFSREWSDEPIPDYGTAYSDIDSHFSDPMRERIKQGRETVEQARAWIRETRAASR